MAVGGDDGERVVGALALQAGEVREHRFASADDLEGVGFGVARGSCGGHGHGCGGVERRLAGDKTRGWCKCESRHLLCIGITLESESHHIGRNERLFVTWYVDQSDGPF